MCVYMYVMCVLIKLIFEESCKVYSVCPILFYSCKKRAGSKETEIIRPLPLKMKLNVVSQEPQSVNQFFDKKENVVLHKTASESIDHSCPRENTTEEYIDKMYLDILRKKLSVGPSILSQDDKIKKVSVYTLN